MKFLKFLLSFPYAALAGWLLWLLFRWIIPIAMDISWFWFIVYCILACGFVGAFFKMVSGILAGPSAWLCQDNLLAKLVQAAIFCYFGYKSLALLWTVTPHGVLQWLIALSFTATIIATYYGLIRVAFHSSRWN